MAVLEAYRAYTRPLPGVGRREAPRPSLQYQARQRERMRELGLLPEAPPSPLEVAREQEARAERERATAEEMQIRAEKRAIEAGRAEREEQREYERKVARSKHEQALELAEAKAGRAGAARRRVLGLPALPRAAPPGARPITVPGAPPTAAPGRLSVEERERAFGLRPPAPGVVAGPPVEPELRVPALPPTAPAVPEILQSPRTADLLRGYLAGELDLNEALTQARLRRGAFVGKREAKELTEARFRAWKAYDPEMEIVEAQARARAGQIPPRREEPAPAPEAQVSAMVARGWSPTGAETWLAGGGEVTAAPPTREKASRSTQRNVHHWVYRQPRLRELLASDVPFEQKVAALDADTELEALMFEMDLTPEQAQSTMRIMARVPNPAEFWRDPLMGYEAIPGVLRR